MSEHHTHHNIDIDTVFWKHRSPFLGSQEQLDELAADTDRRAAARAHGELYRYIQNVYVVTRAAARPAPRPSVYTTHRPAIRKLTPIVHVGLIPMLWAITTCGCGDRWPCNDVKRHMRAIHGWTTDITGELKAITKRLPKPATRWRKLKQRLTFRSRSARLR